VLQFNEGALTEKVGASEVRVEVGRWEGGSLPVCDCQVERGGRKVERVEGKEEGWWKALDSVGAAMWAAVGV